MTDVVELAFPARADLLVLARLTAATVASRADFGVDDIEDLRLAVEELCLGLVRGVGEGTLHLRFAHDVDLVEIACTFRPASGDRHGPPPVTGEHLDEDDLSGRILDGLVDQHGRETVDGTDRRWLKKRRAETLV
jgi:hypothetical protein